MAYCILPSKIKEFKKALKNKDLDVFELIKMTSEARTELFRKFAGEDAKKMNTLFEEKIVLKNRIQGIKNWASKVGEIGRYDPAKKAELEKLMSEYKERQQERMFNPKENESFLADLVEEKFGTRITSTEAKNIFRLQAKAEELKKNYFADRPAGQKWISEKDRINYGLSQVMAQKYIESLKNGNLSLKESIKKTLYENKLEWTENKFKSISTIFGKTVKTVRDVSVSLVASWDNSFLGRQGLHSLLTEPTRFIQAKVKGVPYNNIWWNMAKKSFSDIVKELGQKNAKDAVMADYLSRENYMNGEYSKAKLVPKTEEQFPTSLPEKIPVFGRIYTAAESAFINSAIRARIDLYDFYKKLGEKNGVKWDEAQVKDAGTFINALTARGKLGQAGESPIVKVIMWAPKMLKANWDVLTAHTGGTGLETTFARQQAAMNMVSVISTSYAIMNIANAIWPGSAETDPRSSDFGKIRIGNTRFDYTGGAASLITLASRLATQSTKSSTTGAVTELGTGYGQSSWFDVAISFLTNKTTPPVGAVIDWAEGQNFQGDKPTIANTVYNAFTPIAIQNAIDLKDDASAEAVWGAILDGIGINASTYAPNSDWGQNTGKELLQFQATVGSENFKNANDKFNEIYGEWINNVRKDEEFVALSDEDKKSEITKEKKKIKDDIYNQYDFKYDKDKEVQVEPLSFGQKLKQVIGFPISQKAFNAADVSFAERMDFSTSTEIKTEMMKELNIPQNQRNDYKLDHTLPLELCDRGNEQCNAKSNLKIVSTDVWKSYTPLENALKRYYLENKLTLKEAQELILKYKAGEVTADEIYAQYK